MCGISGVFNADKSPVDRDILISMTEALHHRGPDDKGIFVEDYIGLGHRRLSILDLSSTGHCPMVDEKNKAWITYNGEVYNYVDIAPDLKALSYIFRSSTDTEVVLNSYLEYGEECLQRFNGMWSLAIWDKQKQQLFCARDRFGVKPFYYTWDGKHFRFASEIKALLSDTSFPRRVNHPRLMDFLFNGAMDHSEETLFEGVYQLLPGHYLIVNEKGLIIKKYWELHPERDIPITHTEQIEKFNDLFTDAVKIRLRSDVPIGTCLSGGLDSSAIVCVANQLLRQGAGQALGTRQKTFSACFTEPAIDERSYIKSVLERTQAQGHEIYPTSSDIAENLEKILWHQDEPFASASACAQYFVMQKGRQEGVTVLLDGQGSDEMLAGYEPHFVPYMQDLFSDRKWSPFIWEVKNSRHLMKVSHIQRPLSEAFPSSIYRQLWKSFRSTFFPGIRYTNGHTNVPPRLNTQTPVFQSNGQKLNKALYRDFHGVRLQVLLHLEDRNSMANGIESRTPFLDYRLVEYVFALPNEQKRLYGVTKVILRQALKDVLPPIVLNRKDKLGFVTPASLLLEPPMKDKVNEILNSSTFKTRSFFDAKEAAEGWDQFQNGNARLERTVWQWLIVELWMQQFKLSE